MHHNTNLETIQGEIDFLNNRVDRLDKFLTPKVTGLGKLKLSFLRRTKPDTYQRLLDLMESFVLLGQRIDELKELKAHIEEDPKYKQDFHPVVLVNDDLLDSIRVNQKLFGY